MGKVKEYIGEEENFSYNSYQTIDELIDFLNKAKSLGATNIHFDFDESDGSMYPYFEREETEEEIGKRTSFSNSIHEGARAYVSALDPFFNKREESLNPQVIKDAQFISFMNLISKNQDNETTI